MDDAVAAYQLHMSSPAAKGRLELTPQVAGRRPIVMVLGMHRSGTSLCSHVLSMLGVDMADNVAGPGNLAPTPDNPRGHWERWEIVELHDRILALFNRSYYGICHDFPLPVAWWADPRVAHIRREIVAFVEGRIGRAPFGFKDPRTMRLMPMWRQIVDELRLEPKLVVCLRNPAQVARSLQARDGLHPEIGEHRWFVYMMDFFRFAGAQDVCVLEYERWFDDPRRNADKLASFLGLDWPQAQSELDLAISDIVDPGLRHDDVSRSRALHPLVASFYKLATRVDADPEARAQIGYISGQFVGFQQLYKPFRQSFEDTAVKLPAVEEAAAAARAAAEERSVADAARLSQADGELQSQRARVTELERAHQADAAALVQASQAAAALQTQVATANEQAAAAATRLSGMLGEIEALRARVAELAGELHGERARVAALEHELDTQRVRLAEVQRERDAGAAALARAQHDRAEEERALRAEMTSLRAKVEASRAAGRTAVAALRAEIERAQQRLQERAVAAGAMADDIASLRRQAAITEAEAERHGTDAAQLRAQVGQLREAAEESERAAQERDAAAAAMTDEIAELRHAAARAGRAAEQDTAHAAALRAEIAALRRQAERADQMARQRAASAAAVEAENAALREAGDRAAQDAHERDAALRAELAALRHDVAAARRVGRAMIAALRVDPTPLPRRSEPDGWWGVGLRRLGWRPQLRGAGRAAAG
ncbi:MAG TPA: hypothetical protein VNV18_14420 [Stellaceae bacterium]|jgi:hypothetical protein|nr:hypothetical protein [Stellaceae bacterium]